MNCPAMPCVCVFWVQRPVDKEPWPVVCQDAELAARWPHRCSSIVVAQAYRTVPQSVPL